MSLRWGQDYGADVDKYSAKYQEIDSIFEGSEDIVPSGMDQIVKILETGLHIELEKPVKRIQHSADGVSLTFKDESTEFYGKLILTCPLGVLQARDIDFKPELPEDV